MPVDAVLITGPAVDFTTFLGLTHTALGYNLANTADASHRKLTDAEKYLSCLAAFKEEDNDVITPSLLAHVSFSVLIAAEERDLLDIVERTGMSFVHATTTTPGVSLALVTGTLAQWRDAVVSGTNEAAPPIIRACFSKILLLFDRAGLTSVWNNFERRPSPDRSGFLLEYHA